MRTTIRAGALMALLAVTLPEAAWAQGGAPGTTPLFSINLGTTVWTTIVFLSLLAILWKFAWGPILTAADQREKGIQQALDEAKQRHEEASRLLEEHKQQLAEARKQANEVIAEGKTAAERVRKELEEKARAEAQGIVERAREEIERERDAALQTLRKEAVELALAAASQLLHEKVDQQKDRALVERFLQDVSADAGRGAGA